MIRQTGAAVLSELGRPLRLLTLTIPALKSGQVLVQVAYSGVCHTQLLEVQGKRGEDHFLPHTLGHEGTGTVLEVGKGVRKVKPGDRVVLSWIKGDGADVPSTIYDGPDGPVNSGPISTFMHHTVTCESRVTTIPDEIPLREAALLGCTVPTGAGVILNVADVRPGSSVAILGIGGVGLSAVMAASLVNASPIIAVDVVDSKLELARQMGATHLIDARRQDSLEAIRSVTGGHGLDYAIECAGQRATMEIAFQAVRENGGLCILVGNLPHGESISIDPFALIKGKRIVGTAGGGSIPDRDVPMYVNLHLSEKLNLAELITQTFNLADVNRALEGLGDGKPGRALLRLSVD